jgi:hypothetical protein
LVDIADEIKKHELAFKILHERYKKYDVKQVTIKEQSIKTEEKNEIPDDLRKKAEDELRDTKLLLNIIKEVQKRGLIGNEDTIILITSKVMTNYVIDVEPISKSLNISDNPDGGKDKVVKDTLYVVKTKHEYCNGLSEKALLYWSKDWNGQVLYIEDPPEELLKSNLFKTLMSGKGVYHTVVEHEILHLEIKGQPVIILTSYVPDVTIEGDRRIDFKPVDTTDEITTKVENEWLIKVSGTTNKPEYNTNLINGLNTCLKSYDVIIPDITNEIVKKNLVKNMIRGKSNIKRYTDYIKSSAILHQYQREKDKEGRLIANLFDILFGSFLYYVTRGYIGKSLNTQEKKLISFLYENGTVDLSTIEEKIGLCRNTIYTKIQEWMDKGLVEITTIQKSCGCVIKDCKALKLKDTLINSSLILNDFNTILNEFFKTINNSSNNIEYIQRFNDFNEIMKEIDKNREKHGLKNLLFILSLKSLERLKSYESTEWDVLNNVFNTEKIGNIDIGV